MPSSTVATATSVLCHPRKSVDFSVTSSVHFTCPSISALWHRSHFWVPVFGLTGKSKRNLIHALKYSSCQEALVKELSSYEYAPLREGEIALYRGSGNGLAPILLVAAEETSLGCVERLEHEYALKCELDAD